MQVVAAGTAAAAVAGLHPPDLLLQAQGQVPLQGPTARGYPVGVETNKI